MAKPRKRKMNLKVANHKPYDLEINDFTRGFGLIINAYNRLLPASEKEEKNILYGASYPDYIIDETGKSEATTSGRPQNFVVYSVSRRDNGTLGDDPYSAPREVRPRPREEIPFVDSSGANRIRTIYGKFYDNTVKFECVAPSAVQADDLIYRVEGIFEVHAPWLESLGFNKIIYAGRTIPTFNVRTEYHARAFNVYLKTERLWYRDDSVISSIQQEVNDELIAYGRVLSGTVIE